MTWLYLLKDRSQIFSAFKNFHDEIQNQFNTNLKCLRSHNAREFFSTTGGFQDYLSSHGILHQSSCAYTSQQNGVAVWKLRYLLEVARTLLFQMQVPKSFWSDAILTACFLSNRLPSSVLHGDSQFHIVYPHQDPFPLTPRVFGCVCFVNHLGPGRDKLDPRSERCVFLGYSRTQKGYRCYSPRLRRWYVSADVTFFESEPFFGSSSGPSNVRSEPEVTISLPELSPLPTTPVAHPPACPPGQVDSCAPRVDRPSIMVQYKRRPQQPLAHREIVLTARDLLTPSSVFG
ncbi:retrovirus-related Pol polyprotein from transposon RE2 isoform X1 [Tasmannia lanceolata]|uniref:retrovirus-related Pol polyprotein from transposon RE2 isoform X1 n=1 Tax=Tasmannia lanceolata TaxID=3420 RepID=UPI004064C5AC